MNLEQFLDKTGFKMRHLAEKMGMRESRLRYHIRGNFRDGKKDKRGTETAKECAKAIKTLLAEAQSHLKELTLGEVPVLTQRPKVETPVNVEALGQAKKKKRTSNRE